jgi:hypothetical protein
MPHIEILTDGTSNGTQLIIDGKDITDKEDLTHIGLDIDSNVQYVDFSYTSRSPYKNDKGENQGYVSQRYRYVNDEGIKPIEPPKPIGTSDEKMTRVGGKTLKDVSRAKKAERLVLGR